MHGGCASRLEEPLTRFEVSAAFHGHAHKGAAEGRTSSGIPVFNVAMAVLEEQFPDAPPFRLFEVRRDGVGLEDGERRQAGRRRSDRTGDASVTPLAQAGDVSRT